jgi:cysteine synthase
MGAGRFLKEQNPDVQIIAVEPPLGERVEGLRNMDEGYIPPVFENWNGFDLLDRKRVVRPASRSSGRAGSSPSAASSPASRRAPRSPAP